MERVRAVIVHRNRPDALLRTVAALREQGAAVTVVDSGSEPDALRTIRGADADIIDARSNVGFGPGANLGLTRWLAGGREPFAVVAPHDALPAPGCVRTLIGEMAARPRAGLACAEYGPGEDLKPTMDRFFGGSFVPWPRGEGWEPVDYPHGTLMAIRREAAEEVGLFDERFFAYCEEADLGLRARNAGWEVGMVWGAIVDNGRPPRGGLARYLQLRNTLLLLEKHYGTRAVVTRVVWEIGVLASGRVGPTLGVGASTAELRRATVDALRDYLRRRFGPPPPDLQARDQRARDLHASELQGSAHAAVDR